MWVRAPSPPGVGKVGLNHTEFSMKILKTLLFAVAIAAWTIMPLPCAAQAAQAELPAVDEVKAIAEEAYAYGLPLVMAYTASY